MIIMIKKTAINSNSIDSSVLRVVEQFRVSFVNLTRDRHEDQSDHRLADEVRVKRATVVSE